MADSPYDPNKSGAACKIKLCGPPLAQIILGSSAFMSDYLEGKIGTLELDPEATAEALAIFGKMEKLGAKLMDAMARTIPMPYVHQGE